MKTLNGDKEVWLALSEAKAVMTARDEKRSADEAATEVEKFRIGEEKGALQGVS